MCLEATVIGQHMCKAPVKVTKKDESEYPWLFYYLKEESFQ